MKAKIWLRGACLLILLHLLGHAGGHSTWDHPEDPEMQEVVNAMHGYASDFMGATRSMADYFNGYSIMLFFVFAMSISILWAASNFPAEQRTLTKKILYPLAFAWMAFGVIEFMYFFPLAAGMSLGAGILILFGISRLSPRIRI